MLQVAGDIEAVVRASKSACYGGVIVKVILETSLLSAEFGRGARSQEGGEKEGETDAANLRSLRFLL